MLKILSRLPVFHYKVCLLFKLINNFNKVINRKHRRFEVAIVCFTLGSSQVWLQLAGPVAVAYALSQS